MELLNVKQAAERIHISARAASTSPECCGASCRKELVPKKRRKLDIVVTVVPPRTNSRNDDHPHFEKTPQQRRERMLRVIIDSLAQIKNSPAVKEPETVYELTG